MKYLGFAIVMTIVISVPAFRAQAKPGTQNPQQKKTSSKESTPRSLPSEKEKQVRQGETRKPNETAAVSTSPIPREERLSAAVALALFIGTQADVDDPLDEIRIRLESAKLLTKIKPNESSHIVAQAEDLLLERKKKEQSEDGQIKIAALERELIALYSKLDPEKTEKFIQSSLDVAAENIRKLHAGNSSIAAKARAEKMAELAAALIDNAIPTGVDLILNSVAETGRVANAFVRPFRKALIDPAMREIMSARIKQALSGKIVAEPNELSMLATFVIGITGRDDAYSTINAAILELEINSLRHIEATLRATREQERSASYANNALDNLFGLFTSRLRGLYSKWLPERLKDVDASLESIQELVSFKIGERSERAQAETFEEKLDKASAIASGSKRERELINLAFDVLNGFIKDEKYSRDQMVDKVLHLLNTKESKAFVEDGKIVTDIKALIKEKNFSQAANEARRISRDDWRAQVLTGVASCLDKTSDKTDQEVALLLYSNALDVLNASKPGTAIIRTTLKMAERFYEKDLSEGRRLLNVAVRFANQTSFSEKGYRFPFDKNIFAGIGMIEMALGFEPERIQDALRDIEIGKMAQLDWPVLHDASNIIENRTLRAMFQLKMCEGVISQASKEAKKGE